MTDDREMDHSIEPAENGDGRANNVYSLPPSGETGMKMSRFRELSKLDAEGADLDLTVDEQKEYEQAKAQAKELRESVFRFVASETSSMTDRVKDSFTASGIHKQAKRSEFSSLNEGLADHQARLTRLAATESKRPSVGQRWDDGREDIQSMLNDLDESMAEKSKAAELRDGQTQMQTEYLSRLADSAEAQGSSLQALASGAKHQTVLSWIAVALTLLTLIATVFGVVITIMGSQ